MKTYPLIIIGGGPAGLTASIYASRYKVGHLVIAADLGGLAFEAHKIGNFPTEEEISGPKVVEKMQKHAESLGASLVMDKVVKVTRKKKLFEITTEAKKVFLAKTILLATGTDHRHLDLPNEDKFLGKGISYCATCDAMFYQGKTVAVVGGSDSANTASLYLSEIAKKVYQIYRRGKLRGETVWADLVTKNKKIKVIYNTEVIQLKGREKLETIALTKSYKSSKEMDIDGLFIEIGTVPQKELINQLLLDADEGGYIKVDSAQKTSQRGVWAAGDITTSSNSLMQIITACSEGAIAATDIFKFLQENK